MNPPLVLTSTYVAADADASADEYGSSDVPDPGDGAPRFYGRNANPTWEAFEEALAILEGGRALLLSSGMAAIAAVLAQVPHAGRVVVPRHAYSGTLALLDELESQGRVGVERVDIADTDAVRQALSSDPAPAVLWVETPTNPMLEVADLPALTAAARDVGALVVVDNTFATPLVQRPLDLGADVVVHSVTKYLSGHSDVVLGAVVTRDGDLLERLRGYRTLHGAIPGPWEAWLALRGLRTLHLRVERSQANAAELARRLSELLGEHPGLAAVHHPSLPDDPGHVRAKAQMSGFGSIVCIDVAGGVAAAERVVSAVRIWVHATSLGGVESTLERRRRHAAEATTVPESLLRLSVGVEDIEDLWSDLIQALDRASR